MAVQITQEIFTQLNQAANKFTQIVFAHTETERGVHLETAIYAPCFLAGAQILRATDIDFSQLEAGQPVFVDLTDETGADMVNDKGKEVLDFMQKVCSPLGLNPFTGWDQAVPDDHQPLQPGVELVQKMEPAFLKLMAELQVSQELHPHAAAFAGMIIIQMGQQALNPDISKAIALSALVAGSKTVPYA